MASWGLDTPSPSPNVIAVGTPNLVIPLQMPLVTEELTEDIGPPRGRHITRRKYIGYNETPTTIRTIMEIEDLTPDQLLSYINYLEARINYEMSKK